MAVLVRQSHPNLKYIVYDGQATEWLDDFFERGFSRRGYQSLASGCGPQSMRSR